MTMTNEELARYERIRANGPHHYVWTDHDVFTLLAEVKRLRAKYEGPARLNFSAPGSLEGLTSAAKFATAAASQLAPPSRSPTIIGVAWDSAGNYSAVEKEHDGTVLRQEGCTSAEAAERLANAWMQTAWTKP